MKKGISPLIAVIMLIAFTMIVAAILAVWAQHYASSQTDLLQHCIESGIYIHTCRWTATVSPNGNLTIVVKNTGEHDLSFNVILEYENETRHPDIVFQDPTTYNITANQFRTVKIEDVGDDLGEVEVRSVLCGDYGVRDWVGKNYITGLPIS